MKKKRGVYQKRCCHHKKVCINKKCRILRSSKCKWTGFEERYEHKFRCVLKRITRKVIRRHRRDFSNNGKDIRHGGSKINVGISGNGGVKQTSGGATGRNGGNGGAITTCSTVCHKKKCHKVCTTSSRGGKGRGRGGKGGAGGNGGRGRGRGGRGKGGKKTP